LLAIEPGLARLHEAARKRRIPGRYCDTDEVCTNGIVEPSSRVGAPRFLAVEVTPFLVVQHAKPGVQRRRRHPANEPFDRRHDGLSLDLRSLVRPVDHRANREVVAPHGDQRVNELGREKTSIAGVDYFPFERKEKSEGLRVAPLATKRGRFDDEREITYDSRGALAYFVCESPALTNAPGVDEDPRQVHAGKARATVDRKATQELANLGLELSASFGQCRREASFDAMKGTFGESGVRKGWFGR